MDVSLSSTQHTTDEDGFIGWDHNRRNKTQSIEADDTTHTNNNVDDINAAQRRVENGGSTNQDNTYTHAGEYYDRNGDHVPNSSSEEYENDSATTDGRWSLSVRLNSAVDLPSSIIPSMPLCPLMKFGLITVTEEDEIEDLEKSSAKSRRAEFEQEMSVDASRNDDDGDDDSREGNAGNSSNCLKQQSLRIITSSGKKGILAKFQQRDSLEDCISKLSSKPTKIQFTSGKIMSKKDNGMMEWNEEMRWDDIEMPLQAVLCVELSARAVFPPSIMSAMETLSSDYENMSFDVNNNFGKSTNASRDDGQLSSSTNKGGLLGFWRKGRNNVNKKQQQRRGGRPSVSTSLNNTPSYHGSDDSGVDYNDDTIQKEMEKASAAAAVARYLMENHGSKSEEEEDNKKEEKNDDQASKAEK